MDFALKLVSVKFAGLTLAFPTLNFGFCESMSVLLRHWVILWCGSVYTSLRVLHTAKSFAFSFFFLMLEPMVLVF